MKIVNLTPHIINVVNQHGETLASFPSEGIARATQNERIIGGVGEAGVPLYKVEFGETIGLPEPVEGVKLVVSIITANAAKASGRDTSDLLLTTGLVRKDENGVIGFGFQAKGDIIGCQGFATV